MSTKELIDVSDTALLRLLQAAEHAQTVALADVQVEAKRLDSFKRSRGFHCKFHKAIRDANMIWSEMDAEDRERMCFVPQWFGHGGMEEKIVDRFTTALREIEYAANHACHMTVFSPGRKAGVSQSGNEPLRLEPLRAFVGVIQQGWEGLTGKKFTSEFDTKEESNGERVPVSPAARLVWEAVRCLDEDYTIASVETVMREAVTSKGE